MKKIFLSMVAVLAISLAANAQVNLGIKGGLNLYKLGGDNTDGLDTKAGVHLGALAHIHLNDHLAFQPELLYSMQGAKVDRNGDTRSINLNYINIPLLFQYMFDNGFRIEAGPQFGILAAAKVKEGGTTTDVKSSINSLDFGIPIGVGYLFDSGLGIDVRYNFGLSNINDEGDDKSVNRGLQAGLFYQFKGK